jgi:hypothetical protein
MDEAKAFAKAIHAKFPGKLLSYNCSPSFNWKKKLTDAQIATFQQDLARLGYKFQFVTLAGFHALNFSMFSLAREYASRGMSAYADLQARARRGPGCLWWRGVIATALLLGERLRLSPRRGTARQGPPRNPRIAAANAPVAPPSTSFPPRRRPSLRRRSWAMAPSSTRPSSVRALGPRPPPRLPACRAAWGGPRVAPCLGRRCPHP